MRRLGRSPNTLFTLAAAIITLLCSQFAMAATSEATGLEVPFVVVLTVLIVMSTVLVAGWMLVAEFGGQLAELIARFKDRGL